MRSVDSLDYILAIPAGLTVTHLVMSHCRLDTPLYIIGAVELSVIASCATVEVVARNISGVRAGIKNGYRRAKNGGSET